MLDLVCSSSGDDSFRPCEHNWVIYTPFRGEAYICCSKAGCGISKAAHEAAVSAKASSYEGMYGYSFGEYGGSNKQPEPPSKQKFDSNVLTCPVISEYNKARYNKKAGK